MRSFRTYLSLKKSIFYSVQKRQPIEYDHYYPIYNRRINSCIIFINTDNYKYFLQLYEKHVSLIANTFAWVLMPNHFHF